MAKPTEEASHKKPSTKEGAAVRVPVGTKFDKGKPDWSILPWRVVNYLDRDDWSPVQYSLAMSKKKELLLSVFRTIVRDTYGDSLWAALLDVVHVLEGGATIHGRDNWKDVPDAPNRYCNAFYRHLAAGLEERDAGTGLPHKAHALCNLIFLIHFALENT
jgi:hypothetical protein